MTEDNNKKTKRDSSTQVSGSELILLVLFGPIVL
tara:strand:- start:323 stop:424 length:102 start_codon:yes stop_codon:yes gene_type:complete